MEKSKEIKAFLLEDGLEINQTYLKSLPGDEVSVQLKIKSPLVLAGLPWFIDIFNFLGAKLDGDSILAYEGLHYSKEDEISLILPFNVAITGERVALNLLQRASSIATYTQKFVTAVKNTGITILDTRKTTPGLRSLEKYAVTVGGGQNHRFGQNDLWMVKDNHKTFFGGVARAVHFFQKLSSYYHPILVEVHSLDELEEVLCLSQVKHIILDNFSPNDIKKAIELKKNAVTYEVSGGITLDNIKHYLLEGINCISIGVLTSYPPKVDISLKCKG